jgi:D-aminoacyl-tRNA deacylase
MRAVVQRVSQASVLINKSDIQTIQQGFLILLGIEDNDTKEDSIWLAKKIAGLRIFSDEQGLMNLSLQDVKGSILLISQFTLHASTKKGFRPSFIKAAKPDIAVPLYEHFKQLLINEHMIQVKTGSFGAYMEVNLCNDGPVTIIIDTKLKE